MQIISRLKELVKEIPALQLIKVIGNFLNHFLVQKDYNILHYYNFHMS